LARRVHFDDLDKRETDAANLGSAVHAGIQATLDGYDFDTAREAMYVYFEQMVEEPNFVWVKYKPDIPRAMRLAEDWFLQWYDEVLPTLNVPSCQTELEFDVPLLDTDQRVIRLTGTIDYGEWDQEENRHAIKDWKTSGGKPWEPWEKKRWDIQSTVYTFAGAHLWGGGAPSFEFVVMGDKKGLLRIPVVRGPRHWAWLARKCESYAGLIEADLDLWPLSDSSALCSPKWCDAWSRCKGKYLGDDPW
jgi:hypothetical protein